MKTNQVNNQKGGSLVLVLLVSFVVGIVASVVMMRDKSTTSNNRMHKNQILAKNAAEAGYEWIVSNIENGKLYGLVTHKADGKTAETEKCLIPDLTVLDSFEGIQITRSSGWLVRSSFGSNTLSQGPTETLKMKIYYPNSNQISIVVKSIVQGTDSVIIEYTGDLDPFSNYSFISNGDTYLGWDKGRKYSGKMFINGKLYLGTQGSAGDTLYINSPEISATGGLYRYQNIYTQYLGNKVAYINSNKLLYFENLASALDLTANLDFISNVSGPLYLNGTQMIFNTLNSSDDVNNPTWDKIKPKFSLKLDDKARPFFFQILAPPKNLSCNGKANSEFYQSLQDLITRGLSPTDSIFNSSYGKSVAGDSTFRYTSRGSQILNEHAAKNLANCGGINVNPFYKSNNLCSESDTLHQWKGGVNGGQWVRTKVIDLSDSNFYPGKANGTVLDAGSYNLSLIKGSKLLHPITIVTEGEVYIYGDYNIGIGPSEGAIQSGSKFTGDLNNLDPSKNINSSFIKAASIISKKSRIWYLSYDWINQAYGHGYAGKKGFASLKSRAPRFRGEGTEFNAGTYIGVFVSGEPRVSEAFWLSNPSNGGILTQSPNILEGEPKIVASSFGPSPQEYIDTAKSPPKKIDICHIPPGNPENAQTINISTSALKTHVTHHDDYVGICQPPASQATPIFKIWGTQVYSQEGKIDRSGKYGEGENLFFADFNERLKGGTESVAYNYSIPPKFAQAWGNYRLDFGPYTLNPPGLRKNFKLMGQKMKTQE